MPTFGAELSTPCPPKLQDLPSDLSAWLTTKALFCDPIHILSKKDGVIYDDEKLAGPNERGLDWGVLLEKPLTVGEFSRWLKDRVAHFVQLEKLARLQGFYETARTRALTPEEDQIRLSLWNELEPKIPNLRLKLNSRYTKDATARAGEIKSRILPGLQALSERAQKLDPNDIALKPVDAVKKSYSVKEWRGKIVPHPGLGILAPVLWSADASEAVVEELPSLTGQSVVAGERRIKIFALPDLDPSDVRDPHHYSPVCPLNEVVSVGQKAPVKLEPFFLDHWKYAPYGGPFDLKRLGRHLASTIQSPFPEADLVAANVQEVTEAWPLVRFAIAGQTDFSLVGAPDLGALEADFLQQFPKAQGHFKPLEVPGEGSFLLLDDARAIIMRGPDGRAAMRYLSWDDDQGVIELTDAPQGDLHDFGVLSSTLHGDRAHGWSTRDYDVKEALEVLAAEKQ